MIALKLKDEMIYIGIAFVLLNIILKVVFYKELFLNTLKISFGIFWIFVVPGYFMMFYWEKELDFFSRLIIGVAVAGALIGILSYYIGLIGLNIKYHTIIFPIAIILICLFLNRKKFLQ